MVDCVRNCSSMLTRAYHTHNYLQDNEMLRSSIINSIHALQFRCFFFSVNSGLFVCSYMYIYGTNSQLHEQTQPWGRTVDTQKSTNEINAICGEQTTPKKRNNNKNKDKMTTA